MDKDRIKDAVSLFLGGLDLGLDDGAVRKTADRVTKAWAEDLVSGYAIDPADVLSNTWAEGGSEIVVIKNIEFTSVCRDHLLPFAGRASVAYLPDGRVTGLSKIADLIECLSRRLQIQESLTEQIADSLMKYLKPRGAACQITAEHCCVAARGPRKSGAAVTTLSLKGEFSTDEAFKNKFLQLVR
jgi:GTP cyclohydrolase I